MHSTTDVPAQICSLFVCSRTTYFIKNTVQTKVCLSIIITAGFLKNVAPTTCSLAFPVQVTLCDASTFTAKLIGWDAGKDLAVLRLSLPKARLKDLQPARLAHVSGPGGLTVGAPVWAVANTTGLDHTLTQVCQQTKSKCFHEFPFLTSFCMAAWSNITP